MRTRLLVGGAAVALAGGLGAAALIGGDRGGGPMERMGPHGMVVQRGLGVRFTDGFEVLYLHADSPATILEVTSVGGEDALRQLGARIAGPDREIGGIQLLRGYPPHNPDLGTVRPADQALVKPVARTRDRFGYELLIGYQVIDDSQIAAREAVLVRYEVAGEEYGLEIPARLVYCPPRLPQRACERAADRMFPNG